MRRRGRPVRGLIGGFLLGIFVDLDLAFSGTVKLDSVVLTILPIALLVVGVGLGIWAPLGRGPGPSTASSSPLPPPVAWPAGAAVEGSATPGPQGPPPEPPAPPPAAPSAPPAPETGEPPPATSI